MSRLGGRGLRGAGAGPADPFGCSGGDPQEARWGSGWWRFVTPTGVRQCADTWQGRTCWAPSFAPAPALRGLVLRAHSLAPHPAPRAPRDQLNALRREKQKLVEKIMDQYRVLEPGPLPRTK